ncbi:MAG: tetratricopeptide repeat protein [Anaerolineae bacterium]
MPYSPMELVEAFLKTGELDDALDAIDQHLSDHPHDDDAHRLRVQIQMRRLDDSALAPLLDQLDQLSAPTARDYQTRSVILERSGHLSEACDAMREAHQLVPDNQRLSERLLDLLMQMQDYEEALALIHAQNRSWRWLEREGDVLVLMQDDLQATARYGLALAQLDNLKASMREDYLHALMARMMLARAHAYRRLGHTQVAREHYQASASILGNDASISFNLGLLAHIEGKHQEARAICQQALDDAPPALRASMREALETPPFADLKQQLRL